MLEGTVVREDDSDPVISRREGPTLHTPYLTID